MSFNCICVKNAASQDHYIVSVQLLDNTISEYSLANTSTGEECVRRVAAEVNLKEIAYFGLKCGKNGGNEKWLSLTKNLRKQIKEYRKCCSEEDCLLYFKIRFFATQLDWLTEDTTRYIYYLQLRENINDGILPCNEEEMYVLASYALQAEYGDYDQSEHCPEFIQEYQLLPKVLETEKPNSQLYLEISEKHKKYIGMSTTEAEFAYIRYAQQLECYGHEFYSAKDNDGREVIVGPCARGVFLKYDSETPMRYFDWPNIVHMMHSKTLLSVETNNLKAMVEMDSAEAAKYVWQMCVDHHKFYRISGHSKKDSICYEQSNTSKDQRPSTKRRSPNMETPNGRIGIEGEGLVNPAFDDSTLEQITNAELVPESKRTSRESGIFGSTESPFHKQEELCDGHITLMPSTSRRFLERRDEHAFDDADIPAELLLSSYKTFGNAKETKLNQHGDPSARRSYPRASPHQSSGNDRAGVQVARSVSMIVPTTSVDSCSVQTMATSGYSTSTDSGLCNNKSPMSPMSPVSLLSSGSFVYEDYEVPSIDEQCKGLEAVLNEGRLDQEFSRLKLKDEKKSTACGLLPINQTRNRYADILPYEVSRVHLNSAANTSGNDYINASFIKVTISKRPYNYIATQAPLQSTAADFWQMVWEQNVQIIVMLYNKKNGPHESYRYWPKHKRDSTQSSRRDFDKFEVTTQFTNRSSCYKSIGLQLRHKTQEKVRTIIHLPFLEWPDNGIPGDPTAFLEFMAEVESIRHNLQSEESNEEVPPPIVVHCCAGVGRTGVFILADLMIAHLQNQTRQHFNVPRVLSKLRSQRMLLVRTVDQYRFVYTLLIQYLKNSRFI